MPATSNLGLAFMAPGQAQKHVTYNQAMLQLDALVHLAVIDRDLSAPPSTPAEGDRYIIAGAATGGWAGHDNQIAAWANGAWTFLTPGEGWIVWVADEDLLAVWDGSGWGSAEPSLNPTPLVGVNAVADATNRLSVTAPATLLNQEGGDHRLKINKATAGDTASLLFQTGFSGRAEIGPTGDDDLHVRVSADGATWRDAMIIDNATGEVSLPFSQHGVMIDASRPPYGAVGDGATEAGAAIQAALDAALALGGGTVYLPPGTYKCSTQLKVGSSVHLMGAGFATIIRNPSGDAPGVSMGGVTVYASICLIAVTAAKVSRLTVDHATNSSHWNGIQIGETGASSRSADCVVEECQLLGAQNHQYLIYSKCADRTRIFKNRCVGHSSIPSTDTAGIEVFGGVGVEVAFNDVLRCAPGITVFNDASISDSDIRGVNIHHNRIEAVTNGLQFNAASGRTAIDIAIHANTITGHTNAGVMMAFVSGATVKNVRVEGNIARGGIAAVNNIYLNNASTLTQGISVINNTVLEDSTSSYGFYIQGRDMEVRGNVVAGTPANALFVNSAVNVAVIENSVFGAQGAAIVCDGSTDIVFAGNTLTGYGLNGTAVGILARTGSGIRFRGNYFKYGASATPAAINAGTCTSVEFLDNILGWSTTNSKFLGSDTAGGTTFGWTQGIILGSGDGNVHVSGGFPKPVSFGGASTDIPTHPVDIISGNLRMRSPTVPASASATGKVGEIAWDANYLYVCTATNTWKRVAIATW